MKLYLKRPFQIPNFEITCNEKEIIDSIKLFFGENITQSKIDNCHKINIQKKNNNDYLIISEGKSFKSQSPISDISKIIFSKTKFDNSIFALHAGAVAYRNKHYIFIAPTLNGKTTLITYLIKSGFNYINDDCVLIDMHDIKLIPYYKPIHLRFGGLKILEENNIDIITEKIYDGGKILRYSFFPEKYIMNRFCIDGIFFIELNHKKNYIEDLVKKDIILKFLKSPIKPYDINKEYLFFLKSLSNIFCKKIVYKDLDFISNYIKCISM